VWGGGAGWAVVIKRRCSLVRAMVAGAQRCWVRRWTGEGLLAGTGVDLRGEAGWIGVTQ